MQKIVKQNDTNTLFIKNQIIHIIKNDDFKIKHRHLKKIIRIIKNNKELDKFNYEVALILEEGYKFPQYTLCNFDELDKLIRKYEIEHMMYLETLENELS